MDAKELMDWFINAPEGSQPFYAIPEEGRGTLRSALRLAATLEGPEEATPETDACQGSDGTIRECDELADKSRSLEQRMYRALRALRECEERAGLLTRLCQLLGDNPNDFGPSCDYKCEICDCGYRAWIDEVCVVQDALAAKGDGNDL